MRCNERPYRYVWGAGAGPSGWFQDIVKLDTAGGQALSWSESDCYPGEPVFVAEPGAGEEDAGVLLSVVLDARAGTSFLLVLDARDLSGARPCRRPAPHPPQLSRTVRRLLSREAAATAGATTATRQRRA